MSILLQHWHGYIDTVYVSEQYFSAILIDITKPTNPDEYVELGFDKIDSTYIPHLASGLLFDLFIYSEENNTTSYLFKPKERTEKEQVLFDKKLKEIKKQAEIWNKQLKFE